MGITRAIGNAFTGLNASARAAEIVSRNIANANVAGYAAKRLDLSHQVFGGQGAGVRVDGVARAGDTFATSARMRAEGGSEKASTEAETMRRLSDLLLDPGGEDSLQSRYQTLEAALITLADTPESAVNQKTVAAAASGVARKLNILSTEVVRVRADVDAEIARQVSEVNDAMRRIEGLNREIEATSAAGRDASSLEDERQRQVDRVNRIVPIRAAPQTGGGALLTSAGGAVLMEGESFPLSFTAMAVGDASSALGGLTQLGRDVTPPASATLGGGSLEALFRARDALIPQAAAELDALASDLVGRFQNLEGWTNDPAATGAPTLTGLFTGAGAPFDPATSATGLAGTIQLNAAFDPDATGGDPGRLVTGAAPGGLQRAGGPTYATALRQAMTAARPQAAAIGAAGPLNALDAVTEVSARVEAGAARAEEEAAFSRGTAGALRDAELEGQAVDTDAELSDLLAIERAYAANARVLQAADDMLQRLLEI
jgi:flagellar hook-associated protein 1 FlgK